MNGFAARVMVALVVVALGAGTAMADGETPVSNESFSVTLPVGFGQFTSQTQKSKAPDGGEIETTNYVSKSPTGEAVVVTVSRMPAKVLDPQKLMNSTRDTLISSLKATLESEQKVEGELPSVELLFHGQSANPPYLRSRLAVQDDRFFQILYVGRNEAQRALPSVARLFESFQVAPAAAPAARAGADSESAASNQ